MSSIEYTQPDYASIINAMPEVMDFRGSAADRRAKAAAARKAAMQALVTRYGGLGSLHDQYGDVDEATRAAAANNQFSDLARLQRSYDQGTEGVKRNLAARRMLQSGELQHGLDQVDIAKGTSEYDLGQRFMNAAQGIFQGYGDVEGALASEEAGVINNAAMNAGLNYSVPTPAPRPAPAPTTNQQGSYSSLAGDRVPQPLVEQGMSGPVGRDQPLYYSVVDGALKGLGFE